MSLFDDDFYSTKQRKDRRKQEEGGWSKGKPFDPGNRPLAGLRGLPDLRSRTVWLAGGTGAAVMLVVVLLVQALAGTGSAKQAVMSAKQMEDSYNNAVVQAAERVKLAIVSIVNLQPNDKNELKQTGIGSGIVFEKNGSKVRIVTNYHVVDGGKQFEVYTASGEKKKAELLGKDQITDLAVLETDASNLTSIAEFGDSASLKAGETVIALGNPLGLGFSPTVTKGIVSSPKRSIPISFAMDGQYDWEMELIQTDASINQGNSGGALVNLAGQVVGINSLKISDMGVEGLGFAIPIKDAEPVIRSLIDHHKVIRPLMGVSTQELQLFQGTEELKLPADVKSGLIVIEASGPAKSAGLKSEDVIVAINGKKVETTVQLRKFLYNESKIGDKIEVAYYREGKKQKTDLTLAEAGEN
ncbi:trypsin-like peptidase domain-containing protein [Paenibacillus chitinolyticus]|uniref:S1C family serine protease n=1 Tax=Paenibacillus chitinolyticus TaxID=79263 RepID=UPI002DC027B0|nr:trypsin-like peptidase domain-containing protein [Paenibacillus chitinolyticus]MEC0244554.1 trypsin-like peptidase domain-containing protein [Paenibacillus chitinolyticus]